MIFHMPVRDLFRPLVESEHRFGIIVAHRRAGKTVACAQRLLKGAMECKLPQPRFGYVAPFLKQSKAIAWDYLRDMTEPIPGTTRHETELRVDFPNGARIRLYGADNPDAARGGYLDGVILDEYADMDPRMFTSVVAPSLADRNGWAFFIGTPKGRNDFAKMYDDAGTKPDWYRAMFKAAETGLIDGEELALQRSLMSEDEYAQEYECSFDAAVRGAYYAKLVSEAEADGRVCGVPYDPSVPVWTAWDLGIGDATAIWFAQVVGREVHLIDYYESSGVGLDHYVSMLRAKPYKVYEDALLPHDAAAKELGTGRSRSEVLDSLGCRHRISAAQSVDDGINAARMLMPRCWFDAKRCARGIEALRLYRAEYDDKLKVLRQRPLHDWTSHCADAFRYLALGLEVRRKSGVIKYPRMANVA